MIFLCLHIALSLRGTVTLLWDQSHWRFVSALKLHCKFIHMHFVSQSSNTSSSFKTVVVLKCFKVGLDWIQNKGSSLHWSQCYSSVTKRFNHLAASRTSFTHHEIITVSTSCRTCTVSPELFSSPLLSVSCSNPVQVVLRLSQAWLHWESHTLTQIIHKFLTADSSFLWNVFHFHCSTFSFTVFLRWKHVSLINTIKCFRRSQLIACK